MSLNKFGRSSKAPNEVKVIRTQNLFAFTSQGDYDLQDRKLCNVKIPTEDSDAATKKYVDANSVSAMNTFNEKFKQTEKLIVSDVNKKISNLTKTVLTSSQTSTERTTLLNTKIENMLVSMPSMIDQKVTSLQTQLTELSVEYKNRIESLSHKLDTLESDYKKISTTLEYSKEAPEKKKKI